MTPHDRFLACMHFEAVDHPPVWEWSPWPTTLRRWQEEELGEGQQAPQYNECENNKECPVDFWMRPRFEECVVAEDERFVTRRSDRGIVSRTFKDADQASMPEHLEYPVKSLADWQALKPRFDPADPGRFPASWQDDCRRWRREGPVLIFRGPRSPSLFGFVRELLGPERTLLAFHDEPAMVHDMMEVSTELTIELLRRTLPEAPITAVYLWEDMCYCAGPLISPAMFRQFMVPRYQRITEAARALGIDTVFVDSDGNVEALIPLWLEAGVNGVYPMEVAAGMDVVALRRTYGKDLLMTGGIDKRVLALGRDDIDRELAAKLPLAEAGGYIPHIDHSIPHNVPYVNFAYYWQRKKAMLGIP